MAQTFGILGFLLSLLALFFASEVMRRAQYRQLQLEQALFKATTRIQQIEGKMAQVDRLATEIRHERKRQAETIKALAQKGGISSPPPATVTEPLSRKERAQHERFTPSSQKAKQAG